MSLEIQRILDQIANWDIEQLELLSNDVDNLISNKTDGLPINDDYIPE